MTEQQAAIMRKILAATTDSTKARLVHEYARIEVAETRRHTLAARLGRILKRGNR
jgi:hypothetical protein